MLGEKDRLEKFLVLRSEIHGSEEFLVVGIDVAKEKHHAFYGTATGEVLRKRFVQTEGTLLGSIWACP